MDLTGGGGSSVKRVKIENHSIRYVLVSAANRIDSRKHCGITVGCIRVCRREEVSKSESERIEWKRASGEVEAVVKNVLPALNPYFHAAGSLPKATLCSRPVYVRYREAFEPNDCFYSAGRESHVGAVPEKTRETFRRRDATLKWPMTLLSVVRSLFRSLQGYALVVPFRLRSRRTRNRRLVQE